MEHRCKMCQRHWSVKYKSRSSEQDTCQVSTSRRNTMQGMVVVGLIVAEILNVDVNCLKVTGAQNIGQGHQIKVPAKSVEWGETLSNAWLLKAL